jgi:uncharacterized protein YecT (DUF1311 family)
MLRTVVPLALLLLLAPSLAAPLAAAEPSFDYRTARTPRELATCADARIAAADRELAAAWRNAIAGLDPAAVKALRADQKKFLEDLDSGFEGEVWGKQSPPEGRELRAQIARTRRGGDFDALSDLEAQLRERIVFLRNLTPAASYAGLWKNHDSELWLAANGGEAHYRATFGTTTFGWAKYHCHFTRVRDCRQGLRRHGCAQHRPGGGGGYREHAAHGALRRHARLDRGDPGQCGRSEAPARLPARRRLCRPAVSHRPQTRRGPSPQARRLTRATA